MRQATREQALNGLQHAVQYRRKDQTDTFDPWHTMAAFDSELAADRYFKAQSSEMWEYQLIGVPEADAA